MMHSRRSGRTAAAHLKADTITLEGPPANRLPAGEADTQGGRTGRTGERRGRTQEAADERKGRQTGSQKRQGGYSRQQMTGGHCSVRQAALRQRF